MDSIKKLSIACKPYVFALVLAILGIIISRLAEACVYKFLIPNTLDSGLIDRKMEFLAAMPRMFIGIFFAIGVGEFLSRYFMAFVARSVVRDYRRKILYHLLDVPVAYYKKYSTGSLVSKINYDAEQVASAISDSVRESLSSIIAIIMLFAVMISLSWKVTLGILVVAPTVALVLRFVGKKMRHYSVKVQKSMSDLTHLSTEIISGYQVVKIYQGQEHEGKRIDKAIEVNLHQELRTHLIAALSGPVMQLIGGVVLVGFIFFVLSDYNNLLPGQIFGLIGVLFALIRPLKQITGVNNVLQKGVAGINSINKLLEEPLERKFGSTIITSKINSLKFNDISFAYPDNPDNLVLENISFEIKRGQTIALVGSSGSGKSSIVALLAGFYQPNRGNILLDTIDIESLSLKDLRSQIAIITQQVVLFNESVANNIAYGLESYKLDDIKHATKLANALDFIEQLPHGFDTTVGENGCLLSGGQRQRIAIARAIYKDAPILILDEATSALDTESEAAIKAGLTNLMQNKITLIIAHRLSTVENADIILVMDKGKIVQVGTHQELINKPGRYAQLQYAN